MKNILSCAAMLICMVVSGAQATHAAVIGFTGDFAPGNWTTTLDGGDGYVNTSNAPTSVVIASADDGDNFSRNTDFSIAMPFTGAISFDWSFTTSDSDGPFYDPFFVGIDGIYTQLTDNDGPQSQSGSYSVSLLAGQVFTLRANSFDSSEGRSETTVSNFMAVPEPTSMAIFGLGTLGMAYRSRRKSKA
jgi:hypothetical protein